jgi:alpha-1,6-mannosyltransferase
LVKGERVAPAVVFCWGLVIAGCILGISFFDRKTYPLVFDACTALAGLAYLRTLWLLGRFDGGSYRVLALCLVLGAGWRVPLLLKPPTLSTDVYRYVWDGRIQRLGYDPYVVVPGNSKFRQLHTAETRLMNHPDVPTPYPAGAELFFRAVVTVKESALAMKSAIVLCDAALIAVLLSWLVASRRSPWWVLAYAWNPLVTLEGAGNGHVDLLGALCLVLSAASLARGRRTIAALALAVGISVKFLPAVLLPVFWRRIGIRDAALAIALVAGLYLPFLKSGGLPVGSLGAYLAWWRINAPLYSALEGILPSGALMALPAASGFAVAIWARRHWAVESPETWAWPAAIALLFAPSVFPWYLLWLTPFLFSPGTLPLAIWSVSVLATYCSLPWRAARVVEYGAAAIAAAWMIAARFRPHLVGPA